MKVNFVVIMVLVTSTLGAWGRSPPEPVVVMPFNALGTADRTNGIGVSVQQAIAADLSRLKGIHPISPAVEWPVTIEIATKAANDARATLVIYGSYHLHEGNLRITGQILDVRSSRFIGSLKATGQARDLFAIQDVVVQQARRVLEPRVTPPPPATQPQVAEEAPPVDAQALIEPLGPVPAVWPWNEPNPVLERARQRIANQDDYDRVTYTYRNTYGFAPVYGFYPGYAPYYPRVYYRYRSHPHRHHHHHHRWR